MALKWLFTGSSNLKRGTPPGPFFPSSIIKVWNCAIDTVSTTTGLGTALVTPVKGSLPFEDVNNLPFWFHAANKYTKVTGQAVDAYVVTRGGTDSDEYWNSGPQAMLNRVLAVLNAAGVTHLDAFIFNQWSDEDEANTSNTTYIDRYLGMWGHLEGLGLVDANTREVLVSPAAGRPSGVLRYTALYQNRKNRPSTLIPTKYFPTSDGQHLTGESAEEVGLFAAGMVGLLGQ